MLLRPSRTDVAAVGHQLGLVLVGMGALMAAPAAVALLDGDLNGVSAFVAGAAVSAGMGALLVRPPGDRRPLTWSRGLVAAGAAWPVAALAGAVPLALSGHLDGYGAATFEAMSGLTATGLSLLHDLDHLSPAVNLWRHLLQGAGAVAFVVVALTLFTSRERPAGTLGVGESHDERILPNLARTLREIRLVGGGLAAAGILALILAGWWAGLAPLRAAWHGVLLFLSGASTGGFAPTSASVGLYHSAPVEAVVITLALGGATSIAVHRAVQRADLTSAWRNLEVRVGALSLLVLAAATVVGLARAGTMTDAVPLARTGLFTAVSAHTTSGLHVVPSRLIETDWGLIAPAALVAAMAVGGMAASAAGGIKTFRVGLTGLGLASDVRRGLLPEAASVVTSYHHGRRRILDDDQVRAAAGLLLLYLATVIAGSLLILGVDPTADLTAALFETTSAGSNTGLSLGILHPGAPALVKLVLFVLMWLGRLEFLAVFGAIGFLFTLAKGR